MQSVGEYSRAQTPTAQSRSSFAANRQLRTSSTSSDFLISRHSVPGYKYGSIPCVLPFRSLILFHLFPLTRRIATLFYRRRSLGDSEQRSAALLLRIPCYLRLSLISTDRAHRVEIVRSSAASIDIAGFIYILPICPVFERAARSKGEFL